MKYDGRTEPLRAVSPSIYGQKSQRLRVAGRGELEATRRFAPTGQLNLQRLPSACTEADDPSQLPQRQREDPLGARRSGEAYKCRLTIELSGARADVCA